MNVWRRGKNEKMLCNIRRIEIFLILILSRGDDEELIM